MIRTKVNFTVGIDSGAFSVDTGKVKGLTKEQYAEYLHREGHKYSIRFNFDVLGDGPASYANWVWLRKQGLDVMPVYHIGTDEKFLDQYLAESEYIALGAIANLHTSLRLKSLKEVWNTKLRDKDGNPTHKVHGLGLTSARVMFGYPWNTVDSASALLMGSYGGVFLPFRMNEEGGRLVEDLRFLENTAGFWAKVSITTRKGKNAEVGSGSHYFGWPAETQAVFSRYLAQFGVEVGEVPEEEKHTQPTPLLDGGWDKVPVPKLSKPQTNSKVILTEHWTGKVAWNMLFMRRFSEQVRLQLAPQNHLIEDWKDRRYGPEIYFVANPHVIESLRRFNMDAFSLLISFARKELELNRFWKKLQGKPNESTKGTASKGTGIRLTRTR